MLESQSKTLESHSTTLESHGKMLESQSKTLESHSTTLESHGKMLESQSKTLESHSTTLESHGKMLEIHGKSLMNIERDIKAVYDVHKIAVDSLVIARKTQETVEKIANQTAGNSLALKKHTQQIKEIIEDIEKLKKKVS